MQYVTGASLSAGGSSTPTHAVGDLIVLVLHGYTSTIPSLPTGWTSVYTTSASGSSIRVATKVAESTNDSMSAVSDVNNITCVVWRGADSVGEVASERSGGYPALTCSEATSWVGTFGDDIDTPSYATYRWGSGLREVGDTNGAVASVAAEGSGAYRTVVFELVSGLSPVSTTLPVSADTTVEVATTLAVTAKSEALSVSTTLVVSAASFSAASSTLVVSAKTDAFTVPPNWVPPVVIPAIDRKVRTLSARAELVDATGTPVTVTAGTNEPRSTLPLASASVSFKGEVAEQWAATLTFTDPWMIPTDSTHPLWGARNYYVRLWWRILDDGEWTEHLVCTVAIGNSGGQDTGTISGTVQCRDVLSTARGGYGGPLDVGGLTVDEALRAIFERVAPTLPLQVGTSTATLPDVYELGEQDPAKDWTEIAALAGWVVRTGRDGTVVAGPRPTPTVALDWSEGPDCPVTELSWDHGIEHMGNRITVRSSDPDYVGVYATVQDDDPASPTWVGGPWGVHPLPSIDSDAVTTVEAATNLARMHLGRGLRPVEDVSVTIPQRPDLEYRQVVHLARRQVGIGADYRISSWDLDLPVTGQPPAPMSVRMMQRTVEE